MVVSCKNDNQLKEDNTTRDITGKYELWVQGGTVLNPTTYINIVKKDSNIYYVENKNLYDGIITYTYVYNRKGQLLEGITKLNTIIISNDGLSWGNNILKKMTIDQIENLERDHRIKASFKRLMTRKQPLKN